MEEVVLVELFEETVERKVVYEGRIVTLRTDRARLENGRITGLSLIHI